MLTLKSKYDLVFIMINDEKKRVFIYALFIIGSLLIIISTYIFAFQIPVLDSTLASEQEAMAVSDYNYLLGTMYQIHSFDTYNFRNILEEVNPNSKTKLQQITNQYQHINVMELVYFYTSIYRKVPTKTQLSIWENMDNKPLIDEQNQIINTTEWTNSFKRNAENITNLRLEKSILQQKGITIQVIGLVFIHLSTILQFIWFGTPKKNRYKTEKVRGKTYIRDKTKQNKK